MRNWDSSATLRMTLLLSPWAMRRVSLQFRFCLEILRQRSEWQPHILTTPPSKLRFATSPYTGEALVLRCPPCVKEGGSRRLTGGLFYVILRNAVTKNLDNYYLLFLKGTGYEKKYKVVFQKFLYFRYGGILFDTWNFRHNESLWGDTSHRLRWIPQCNRNWKRRY